MHWSNEATCSLTLCLAACVIAAPPQQPIAGQYDAYNSQQGPDAPFPAGLQGAEVPIVYGEPASDDQLFQNLLAAEWAVSNFYTAAVDLFNESSFTDIGLPNTTFARIQEIRNNEVGHVQIMRQRISDASVKPGPCEYSFNFTTPLDFLARQVTLEAAGAAFLPGLVANTSERSNQGVLAALSAAEIRHATWATIDNFKTNPFTGPADTVYIYPLQILGLTGLLYTVPGTCPKENPPFPNPPRTAALMSFNRTAEQAGTPGPGQDIQFYFPVPEMAPKFEDGKEYYAVYFHALNNISIPFDTKTLKSTIPKQFDKGKGVIVAVIADLPGAVTEESVAAGPVLLVEQPSL